MGCGWELGKLPEMEGKLRAEAQNEGNASKYKQNLRFGSHFELFLR